MKQSIKPPPIENQLERKRLKDVWDRLHGWLDRRGNPDEFEDYRDLDAWRLSVVLAAAASWLANSLPEDERFGLVTQMRDSAGSVSANIAEGYGCGINGTCLYHLRQARGSAFELETHAVQAQLRGLITTDDLDRLSALIRRTVSALSGYYNWVERQI